MSLWLIVPRDPLIFRDGKPFTAVPGERAKSMVFPYPSTLAGAVRTRLGPDPQTGQYDVERLKKIEVRGPLLAELDTDGQVKTWYFPAPADALLVQKDKTVKRYSLFPLKMPDGAACDLQGLSPVGPGKNVKDKPLAHPPRYWKWETMQAWLKNPADMDEVTPDNLGIQGPARETRTHVSMDPASQTALPGALFQTSGMEFVELKRDKDKTPELSKICHLALALETEAALAEGVDTLAGERRVVRWQKTGQKFPDCPPEIAGKIAEQKHCRLILATPAHFENGYLPNWLASKGVKVMGIALPRYQTVSGWDYDKRSPKPTRRLAPAGSVYFLEFGAQANIEKFVKDTWLQPISDEKDEKQCRNDGFGLALLGAWDGSLREMEVTL
ncbi:MAG: type III-B CRISPR module-associated protein Cmr3 [Anaerolineae bacterium CG03_land_8_20_14_0_80_58_20]|nr:MAG: type III-B CRISPR module-associated protein Cmr3 [Anaerolineae bacterium CG1_02_58_13]PIV28717.1 MAG: type III-B CRISPR module-associated protein Cmr3 [Anaerolineae bacterium CG03_land_8_20_14_0_80_58_20]